MNHESTEKYLLGLFKPTAVTGIKIQDFSIENHRTGLAETKITFIATLTSGGVSEFQLKTHSSALSTMIQADVAMDKIKKERENQVNFNEELKKL